MKTTVCFIDIGLKINILCGNLYYPFNYDKETADLDDS